MKRLVHVNQHVIRRNSKEGKSDPPITVKTYKNNTYGDAVIICDKEGNKVGRFIYSPDKPLACGARLWFETKHSVRVIDGTKIKEI